MSSDMVEASDPHSAADAPAALETFHGPDGIRDAAAERSKRQREAAEADDSFRQRAHEAGLGDLIDDRKDEITRPEYQDGRPPEQRVTARQAAQDLAEFRRGQARERAENVKLVDDILTERAATEAEQDGAAPAQQPFDVEQQEAQRALAQHEQQRREQAQRQEVEAQIQVAYSQTADAMRTTVEIARSQFPDIRTPADVALLAQTNPARHQAWLQMDAAYRTGELRLRQLEAASAQHASQAAMASQQEAARAHREFGRAEDDKFMKSHPELADRKTYATLQLEAVDYFKEVHGLTDEQIRTLWNTNRDFRSAAGQSMAYAAIKQWRAEKSMKDLNAHAKPLPPVQRPGTAGHHTSAKQHELESLDRQLSRATSQQAQIRAAARLVAARRAAR